MTSCSHCFSCFEDGPTKSHDEDGIKMLINGVNLVGENEDRTSCEGGSDIAILGVCNDALLMKFKEYCVKSETSLIHVSGGVGGCFVVGNVVRRGIVVGGA